MKTDRLNDSVEALNDRLDRVSERISHGNEPEHVTSHDADRAVLSKFPYFLVVCAVMWLAVMVFINQWTFAKTVEMICLVFVSAFSVVGLVCIFYMDRGPFPKLLMLALAFVVSAVMWFCMSVVGNTQVIYGTAVFNIFNTLGMRLDETGVYVVGYLVTVVIMFLCSSGVLYVTMAYLRTYITRVLRTMKSHAIEGTRGRAEGFFMVPDIIDVEDLQLDPEISDHRYDLHSFLTLMVYMFLLGMMISSYLFVNPYFLEVMSSQTMLAIMTMLSMFMPVLIIPWLSFKQLGARVTSSAPRPYYLWKGAKNRLFTTFATLGVFMMLFLISVYFGNNVWDIIRNYILFLFPLGAAAIMYAALYSNNFSRGLRDTILRRFYDE